LLSCGFGGAARRGSRRAAEPFDRPIVDRPCSQPSHFASTHLPSSLGSRAACRRVAGRLTTPNGYRVKIFDCAGSRRFVILSGHASHDDAGAGNAHGPSVVSCRITAARRIAQSALLSSSGRPFRLIPSLASRFRIVQEAMSNLNSQTVLSVHHWTDTLFSFTCTRDASFRFENGQFTMVGLEVDGKPLLRAYSLASANYEEHLEFLSIKVPDGPLTSRLQHLKVGDPVLIGKKPTGTLVADNLLPGKTLWLLSTGTGLAPFMSIIKDPEVYDRYEKIVLTHTCRFVDELAYKDFITEHLPAHEHIGEIVSEKLVYYPTVTREEFANRGRITDLIETKKLFADLSLEPFSVENDRVMLCGSPHMLRDTRELLDSMGFQEGSNNHPGHYVVEKAFVG
jgi:ferredoxin/flavodoxin---NADP+ reductase